jgi:thiol-disulfide isomerase/thioredoxin
VKKLLFYLSGILALFLILFGLNQYQLNKQNNNPYGVPASQLNPATVQQLNDPNYKNIILPKDLDQFLAAKKSGFIYYFHPECPHCKVMTPIVVAKSKALGMDVKEYNLMEFPEGQQKYNITSWPVLAYYQDGKETDRVTGEISAQEVQTFLEKHKS